MDYISALDANGNVQKLAAQVVDTDKKSSIVTVNNQLEQPLTNQELINAINSGLLNQEIIDAIQYGLATEATLANFVQSLTVTGDGLLVKFASQNYYPEIQSVDAIDLDIRDLSFTSDKVDVSGSNIVVTNDSNNPIPISDNGQSITVDGQVELGSTTLTALENITVEINNDSNNPIPISDNGQSITVDGQVELGSTTLTALENITVEINNDSNNPIPISDNGQSITVDGQVELGSTTLAALENITVEINNDSNNPIPISDNGQSITVDGQVELGSTTLAALENITVEINNDTGNPIPVSLQDVSTATKQEETKVLIGSVDETVPSTDTANSGLNGRLKRIAQRITSLIALLPSSLGAKTKDLSFPVTLSTDGVASTISSQIGEVQNSPTANTILARLKTIADYLVAGIKSPANSLSVTQAYASTSILSNVTSSASSVTLLAANNNRKTAIIYNDSTSILYVCLNASVASITNYSFKLQPDGNTVIKGDDYSGEIRGIWASANGFARITEVV